ncbi:hypothetical protein NP493_948g00090 [Ridgeia piscesae]|uniref:Uncharacterized protein n=1 Tax=Ridgeia piscesae TaxID=27915 RepID=A0AAD9KLI2_RIDPI|nr:hypothetical protein NP493_948g00090 [Ridgeia piscesae]
MTFFTTSDTQYVSQYLSTGYQEGMSGFWMGAGCRDLLEANGHVYYTSTLLGSCFRTQMMRNGKSILAQKHSVDKAKLDDAKNCPAETDTIDAQAFIKTPFAASTCPFADGMYQVTYSTNAGDVTCDGDATSTAEISGSTITLNSCYTGTATYTKPMDLTLTCIDDISGSSLDSDTNGDILILGNLQNLPDLNHPSFYCARYKIDGDVVKMSLSVEQPSMAKCPRGNSFTSASNKNVAFVLMSELCIFHYHLKYMIYCYGWS